MFAFSSWPNFLLWVEHLEIIGGARLEIKIRIAYDDQC